MSIYVQLPKPDALKVLHQRLEKEQRFEHANRLPSFRVNLIKDLIKEIEGDDAKSIQVKASPVAPVRKN